MFRELLAVDPGLLDERRGQEQDGVPRFEHEREPRRESLPTANADRSEEPPTFHGLPQPDGLDSTQSLAAPGVFSSRSACPPGAPRPRPTTRVAAVPHACDLTSARDFLAAKGRPVRVHRFVVPHVLLRNPRRCWPRRPLGTVAQLRRRRRAPWPRARAPARRRRRCRSAWRTAPHGQSRRFPLAQELLELAQLLLVVVGQLVEAGMSSTVLIECLLHVGPS